MTATELTSESSKQESNEDLPTLWDSLSSEDLQKLYPKLEDGYFSRAELSQALCKEPSNPVDRMVKKYLEAEVKPYVRRKNLNEGDPDAPAKNAIEIGIKFEF